MIGARGSARFRSEFGNNPPSNMDEWISWGVFAKRVDFKDVRSVVHPPALFRAEEVKIDRRRKSER
jgi:hypothetical protein